MEKGGGYNVNLADISCGGGGDKSWIQFLPGKGYHMIYKGNDVNLYKSQMGVVENEE